MKPWKKPSSDTIVVALGFIILFSLCAVMTVILFVGLISLFIHYPLMTISLLLAALFAYGVVYFVAGFLE
jgi:hypothetical protein